MIEIDIRTLFPADLISSITPTMAEVLVDDLAAAARSKWIALAQDRLHTSAGEYISNISEVKSAPGVAWIELTGAFPNMIEAGFGQFDLRDTLLQTGDDGVRTAADGGRYRSIFFRRAVGKSTGRTGPRLTDLYAAELGKRQGQRLGAAAHRALKKLAPGKSLAPGLSVRAHGDDPRVRAQPLQRGQLGPAGHPVQANHHSDLFAGTYHFHQPGGGSYYGSFRTISTNQPDGWIHPGYTPGAGLVDEVSRYVGMIAPAMMEGAHRGQK